MYPPWRVLLWIIIVAVLLYLLGAWGYRILLDKDWLDSFYLSALTMAGLSLEVKPVTATQKIFIAIFTLVSVALYLVLVATIIACFLEPILLKPLTDRL